MVSRLLKQSVTWTRGIYWGRGCYKEDTFTAKLYSLHWIDWVSQRRTPETRKPALGTADKTSPPQNKQTWQLPHTHRVQYYGINVWLCCAVADIPASCTGCGAVHLHTFLHTLLHTFLHTPGCSHDTLVSRGVKRNKSTQATKRHHQGTIWQGFRSLPEPGRLRPPHVRLQYRVQMQDTDEMHLQNYFAHLCM